ncbi:MAG: DUF3857 domain-containing protein [Muribaculaceae bacterium]|nr:DUF3857 domain-containing protein [Muribaculaceae bacterium]MEE1297428.1 DUF3857 domain-containing protein [Muribaculaceae bacterium]
MKRLLLFVIVLCCAFVKSLSQEYAVSNIPDSLLHGSHLVMRHVEYDVTVKSLTRAEVEYKKAITVLDDYGLGALSFITAVSKFESLKSFSARVYDREGKLIRSFKKSDLKYSEISSHLATDVAHYYITLPAYALPCTIEYEYKKTLQDFIASYPVFDAVPNQGGISVQYASYILNVPLGVDFDVIYKGRVLSKRKIPSESNLESYQWEIKGVPAVIADRYIPQISSEMYVTPMKCEYDNKIACFDTWGNFGIWFDSIIKERDVLPIDLKNKVHEITDTLTSNREKVKLLYEYMCKNCRYVSIQVGIGGIQPMSATEVYNTKFGDCKALSFFLYSMLKEIGIKSNLAFISTKNKQLDKNSVTLATTDHAILKVILGKEILWLECTNSELPFGFIHNQINGHDAVVIDGDRTCVETLPESPDSLNKDCQAINISIKSDGSTNFEINRTCSMGEYDIIAGLNNDDIENEFLKRVSIPNIIITDTHVEKSGDKCPKIKINIGADAYKYGTKTGNRYFVQANPFRYQFNRISKERTSDIDVKYGFSQCDTISLSLPENIIIESLPKNIELENVFGKIKAEVRQTNGSIIIIHEFTLKSGLYDRNKVHEYNILINAMNDCYSSKLVLRKL